MKKTFYSNGKLLITGEYLVLDGAKALAIPTKFGQDLIVENGKEGIISWKSFDSDGSIWFEDLISISEIGTDKNMHETESVKTTLISILREAARLNPNFLTDKGYHVETRLTFPKFWGLGTSSTLINNIAQWFGVDAFELLNNSFGGSGYDIACAQHDKPIIYQVQNGKPFVEEIAFSPDFSANLYFVYLNKKQSSKQAISSYYNRKVDDMEKKILAINDITSQVILATNRSVFAHQIELHETILGDILDMQTVKETFFRDFDGVVKSLGGWGGDFVLVVSKTNPADYFTSKGFPTVIPYNEMILK